MILGGVEIPWPYGLTSYTDGDVLIHALIDALLGASCLGDIGACFPDTEPKYEGCSSLLLLAEVKEMIRQAGFGVDHVDCTLVAQRPKLSPYVPQMRERIGRGLGVSVEQVSVKATTTEHMGFAGREEGMACYAVCVVTPLPE